MQYLLLANANGAKPSAGGETGCFPSEAMGLLKAKS